MKENIMLVVMAIVVLVLGIQTAWQSHSTTRFATIAAMGVYVYAFLLGCCSKSPPEDYRLRRVLGVLSTCIVLLLVAVASAKTAHGQTILATRYTYSTTEEYGPKYLKKKLPSGTQVHYRTPDGRVRMERYDNHGQLSHVRIQTGQSATDLDTASKHAALVKGAKDAPMPLPGASDQSRSLAGMACVAHAPESHTTTFNLTALNKSVIYERSFQLITCTDPSDGSTFRAGWVIVMPNHTTTVTITTAPVHGVPVDHGAFEVPPGFTIVKGPQVGPK